MGLRDLLSIKPRKLALKAGMGLVLGLLLASPRVMAVDNTDVVFLKNGDRITGEVKSLEQGKLKFKTDSLGTIDIEWEEILRLTSSQTLEVELESGEKHYGSLASSAEAGNLEVRSEEKAADLEMSAVVRMEPIEESRWKRLEGSLDLGFGFTSSNNSSQVNLGSEVRYRTRKYLRTVGLSSTLVDQDDGERTRRQSLDGGFQRFLKNRRFTGAWLQFQENEELGLELRSLIVGGFGRHAIQTNSRELSLFAGVALNNEKFEGADSSSSTELAGGVQYAFFSFDDPETDLRVSLTVFPSLTESGRVRAEFEARLRREIVEDFFLGFSVYDSFDSDPPVAGSETNDWGFNSSIGWSF